MMKMMCRPLTLHIDMAWYVSDNVGLNGEEASDG